MDSQKIIRGALILVIILGGLGILILVRGARNRLPLSVEEVQPFLGPLRGHASPAPHLRIRIHARVFEPVLGRYPGYLRFGSGSNLIFFVTKEHKSRYDYEQRIHIFDLALTNEVCSIPGPFWLDQVGDPPAKGGVFFEKISPTEIVAASMTMLKTSKVHRVRILLPECRAEVTSE